jgi:hypothetical protein
MKVHSVVCLLSSSMWLSAGVGWAQSYTGCNGSPATGQLQLFAPAVNQVTGSVSVNGVDVRQPLITPFTWNWGDGSITQGWFPQSHVYADIRRSYTLQVTSHEDNGSSDCAQLIITFGCDLSSPVVTEVISDFPACGPAGILSPTWGRFGSRNALQSQSGEKLELECKSGLILNSYALWYTSTGGQRYRVGKCPFEGGCNTAIFFHSGARDDNGNACSDSTAASCKPTCFFGSMWQSVDGNLNDKFPNPWTWTFEPSDNFLDVAVTYFDAPSLSLRKWDYKYEYNPGFPPVLPVCNAAAQGRFVTGTIVDPPLGSATEAYFDGVEQRLQTLPPPYMPMTANPVSRADLNGDGKKDAKDFQIFQSAFGTCNGQARFTPAADLDADGCVTFKDYQIWLSLYNAK